MAASAAASALTNKIFYQTGSLTKYTYKCKNSVSKGIAVLKSLKILHGALAYGTTYKQGI
jgi:hypothetical protein